MTQIGAIRQIEQDFKRSEGPFSDVTFPEERLLDELPHQSMEDRAALLSIFCTFDYNRDANQLTDNLIELHEKSPEMFGVWNIQSKKALEYQFEDIGFRYPSRDAHAWHTNAHIMINKYSGSWLELIIRCDCDAGQLIERLRSDNFLCLKGDKIAPMYARFLSQYVTDIERMWKLNIPVDTHIRTLSHKLIDDSLDDDEIRAEWRRIADQFAVERHVVDGALWQVGNNWDDWGEEYFEKVT